jgi:hypothetical protein
VGTVDDRASRFQRGVHCCSCVEILGLEEIEQQDVRPEGEQG